MPAEHLPTGGAPPEPKIMDRIGACIS